MITIEMLCSHPQLKLEGFTAPGPRIPKSKTLFPNLGSSRRIHRKYIKPKLRDNSLTEVDFLLKGQQFAQRINTLKYHNFSIDKLAELKNHGAKPLKCHSAPTTNSYKPVAAEKENNPDVKLPSMQKEPNEVFGFPVCTVNKHGFIVDTQRHKVISERKRRNRFTKLRQMDKVSTASTMSKKIDNLLAYQFQQTQRHGEDFDPPYTLKCCDGDKNCNNHRDYRKDRQPEIRYQLEELRNFIHLHNLLPLKPDSDLRLNGFPAHCTDTVILRLMFQMSKLDINVDDS